MITIKEIARLAGTSRGTVDRVLHDRGNVKPAIRARVLAIAEEQQYRSNPFAKALVKGFEKNLIGVVINSKGNRFFDDVLVGIYDTVKKYSRYGFDVMIREIKGYNEEEQLAVLDEFLREDISALAITPMDSPAIAAKLSSFAPLPVIALNSDINFAEKFAFIGCDYYNSGCLSGDIARLMLPPGGGGISIITGSFLMKGHNERIRGFRDVIMSSDNAAARVVSIDENNDDNEASHDVTLNVLHRHKPDLIYYCAAGTEGGVRAVLESGLPAKVIVVDDIKPMRDYLARGVVQAIITQQPYAQGAMLIETVYNYLIDGKLPEQMNCYTENQVKLRHSK
jgi:LacI family transcriptional regulator